MSEEQLLEKALQAVQELAQTGKPITHQAVCSLIGISSRAFLRYPRVNAFLEQKVTRHHIYQRRRVQPEEELVQRVKEALVELSDHGEHITLRKVARQGKMSPEVLKYPQVVVLLEQHGYQKRKPRSERAEELLNLVKDAINRCKASGELISKERVCCMVGLDYSALLRYPQVRILMTQAANEDMQQRKERRFQAREEELTQQVIAALQQLRDQNRRITKRAIGKAVHVSNICLYYPKIKALIESAIQAQDTSNETGVA